VFNSNRANTECESYCKSKPSFPNKPVVCCFAGGKLTKEAIEFLEENKIPNYTDPKRAVLAFRNLIIK